MAELRPEDMVDLPPLPAGVPGGYGGLAWAGLLNGGGPSVIGSRGTLTPTGPVANTIGPGADNTRPRIEGLNLLPLRVDGPEGASEGREE